jgi:hypothetical protein
MIIPTSAFVPPNLSAYRGRVGRRKYSDAKWRKVDVTTHVRGPPADILGDRPPSDGGRSDPPAGLSTLKMGHFVAWTLTPRLPGGRLTRGTPIAFRLPRDRNGSKPETPGRREFDV